MWSFSLGKGIWKHVQSRQQSSITACSLVWTHCIAVGKQHYSFDLSQYLDNLLQKPGFFLSSQQPQTWRNYLDAMRAQIPSQLTSTQWVQHPWPTKDEIQQQWLLSWNIVQCHSDSMLSNMFKASQANVKHLPHLGYWLRLLWLSLLSFVRYILLVQVV